MIFYFLIFLMISMKFAGNTCNFIDQNTLVQEHFPFFGTEIHFSQQVIIKKENIGFGIWMKYEPYYVDIDKNLDVDYASQWQRIYGYNKENQFIFSLYSNDTSQPSTIILFITFDQNNNHILYQMSYSFKKHLSNQQLVISSNDFEGQWIMFYIYFDLANISTDIYLWNQEIIAQRNFDDGPFLMQIMNFQIGGFADPNKFKHQNQIFSKFQGLLSNVFTTNNLIFNNQNQLNECLVLKNNIDNCKQTSSILISNAKLFDGTSYEQLTISSEKVYKLSGWIKLNELNQDQIATVIIRISLNSQYYADTFIGDKVLYLKYFQNKQLELNGFQLTTYSYEFPIKTLYTSKQDDIIQDFSTIFYDILIEWHFISYEFATQINNKQPLFQIYSYKSNHILKYIWKKQINHFTQALFNINIGGDKFTQNFMFGQIAQLSLSFYCQLLQNEMEIICHYTCQTCFGPNQNNCLTCPQNCNRYYQNLQNTCQCLQNYIDVQNSVTCQQYQDNVPSFEITELQILCNKVGYNKCDQIIECQFGYFKQQDECIQCPYHFNLQQRINLMCANCYLYPNEFSQNLTCYLNLVKYQTNENYTYQVQQLTSKNSSYFIIQEEDQNNKIIIIKSGFLNDTNCLDGYFYQDSQCYQCQENCKSCTDIKHCQQCFDISEKVGNDCIKQIACSQVENSFSPHCYTCIIGYVLINFQCVACGQNCYSCDQNGFCKFCNDPQKQYITLNGMNCAFCLLQHCLFCFQYFIFENIIYSTLDLDFYTLELNEIQIQIGCARCQDGFFYNFKTLNCELKCSDALDQDQCNADFENCKFGIIQTNQQKDRICLIGPNGIQQYECSQIPNCNECILKYDMKNDFCIVCEDGYYSGISSGQCYLCGIDNCLKCVQQNQGNLDYWKWDIKVFYKYFLNQNNDHPFELYATTIYENYLEVICLECEPGFLLYNYLCIPGCENNCLKCEIVDSTATCIQCSKLSQGYLANTDSNGKCQECPSFCNGCYQRTDEQISNFNPYFKKNISNEKYSRICVEFFQDDFNTHYFYDSNSQTPIACDEFQKCYKRVTITQKVFCSQASYQNYQSKYFLTNNNRDLIVIDQIFSDEHIQNFETSSFLNQLNELSITEIEIIFKFMPVGNEICIFPKNISAYSTIAQNVFSLNQIAITFQGTDNVIKLASNFIFYNFTTITFSNLVIDTSVEEQQSGSQIEIIVNNLNLYSELYFKDCQFVQEFSSSISAYMIFSFDYPASLILSNIQFQNFRQFNQNIFNFSSQGNAQSLEIKINNLIITNSIFKLSSIFLIQDNHEDFFYKVQITDLKIENSYFSESSILYVDSLYKLKDSILQFTNFVFSNNLVAKSSILFYQPSIINFQIKNLIIQQTIFQESSSFLKVILFNLQSCKFQSITFNNSTLINNNFQLEKNVNQNSIRGEITIQNFEIIDIQYDSFQALFLIVNQKIFSQFIITINTLKLSNSKYSITNSKDFFNQEIQYQSTLMYFDCDLCYFTGIQIERGFGLPEISITHSNYLSIDNLYLTLKDDYHSKTLFNSLDCILEQSYNHNLAIFIGFYQTIILNNISIQNCIVFDSPLILIQGYNLLDIKLNEKIVLKNSIFKENILLVTQANKYSSIFAIISQQAGITNIFNVTFVNNHLNEYYQDVNSISATTIYFSQISGDLQLQQITLTSNIATNTTNTILHIKSNTLTIQDSIFTQNNIINYSQIIDKLLFYGIINDVTIDQVFQIKSYGGNGIIESSFIELQNIQVQDSFSVFGGGFYITTYNNGIIQIENSQFLNTVASLSSSLFSMGGCLYIDSQTSSLNLIISNTQIANSYSRIKGGAIYIIPSLSYNIINFSELRIKDCYAIQDSFLSYSLAKSSDITSQVNMIQISFQMTQDGFEQFLSLIDSLESDVEKLQLDNPLIYLQYGNCTFAEIQFFSTFVQYLIHLEQCEIIKLSNISIKNSTYLFQPLIQISMNSEIQSEVLVQNLELIKISQFQYSYNNTCSTIELAISIFECPLLEIENKLPQLIQSNNYIKNAQLACNLENFLNNKFSTTSLILINQINENQTIRIQNLTIDQVICDLCTSGIILFDFSQQVEKYQVKISDSIFQHSECGLTGCVSIFQNSSFLTASNRLLQQYNYDLFDNQIGFQIEIQQSQFINNSASYGGGLFVQQTYILLKNNKFQWNKAEYGGAVYFIGQTKRLIIFNCIFSQNQALVAGGIYSSDQSFQLLNQLDVYINENNSTSFGDDITEIPRSLSVSLDNLKTFMNKTKVFLSNTKLIEQIIVKPYKIAGKEQKAKYVYFPSGQKISNYSYFDEQIYQYIPYNLSFRILALDKYNKEEKNLVNQYCNLQPYLINTTSDQQISDYYYNLSYQIVYFNQTSGDFNLDDLIILFNPTYPNEIVLRILINCSMITIPIYNNQTPFEIINEITDYSLILDIKTFPCQVGEYLNQTSGGCIQCDSGQNQYSVTKVATGCQFKDNNKINKITPATIQLRGTFWRAYSNSITIEYCYHLENNCQGGWFPGDDSCVFGHIGALCEQCDLYNIRNQGHFYSSNVYSCGNCDQIVGNIIVIIFIVIWTLISIALSVNSTVQTTEEFIIGQRLKCFGVTTVFTRVSTAILIKLFTNYLQIISTIASFQLQVPAGLSLAINSIGNPIQQGSYSLDCFLITLSQIDIIYFRLIWGLIMAVCYILLYFSYGFLGNLLKLFKFYTPQITTTLIYVFIYFQPNLISGLMSLVSYRQISDVRWVQGNVSYLYNTNTHIKWLAFFCTPLLLIFGITIPLNLWYGVFRNRLKLDTARVRQIWGYLFNEYKMDAYFWETIKILQKEIIIIVLIFYEDYVPIKASLVFLVLFAYSLYTTIKKPYMTGKLNEMDSQVTIVCSASIILGSSIYSAQKNNLYEIQWPSYVIIVCLNTLLAIKIISQIILSYFTQLSALIDKIKNLIVKICPEFINYHPLISRLLQNRIQQKERVKVNFAKVKNILIPYVKKLIEFKKQNSYFHNQRSSQQNRDIQFEDYFEDQQSKSPDMLNTKKSNKTSISLYNPKPETSQNFI